MKKTIIVTLSVLLIIAVIGGAGYAVYRHYFPGSLIPQAPTAAPLETLFPATPDEQESQAVKLYKVGIVQNGLGNASKECYEGFITELNERGVLDQLDIVYIVEDDKEECAAKIKELSAECDLLYTIGRYASVTAKETTKNIPVVFGAVNSPDEIGLVASNEAPGGNVTGVSSYPPCFEQIDLIKLLLPDAKSVAVMYSGTDTNAVSQGIIASKEAENIGLTCEKYIVDTEKTLKSTLDKVKEAKTNVIYLPVDKFLNKHIEMISEFSIENKIPVICGDETTLTGGCFATSVVNHSSIGRKAAGMATDILFNGKSPATLSVIYKHDCDNLINQEIADKLGIKIPTTAQGKVKAYEKPTEAQIPTETAAAETLNGQ